MITDPQSIKEIEYVIRDLQKKLGIAVSYAPSFL